MSAVAIAALKPRAGLVLVEPVEEPTKTDSGIILARKYTDPETSGVVLAIGDERDRWCGCRGKGTCLGCLIKVAIQERFGERGVTYLRKRIHRPLDFRIGDVVSFAQSAGAEHSIDGKRVLVLKEEDVLAKVV